MPKWLDDKRKGYTLRWRKRWRKGYHEDLLMWVLMDYFIDFANWEPGEVYIKGHGLVKLQRGEHLYGTKKLSGFFGVTRQKLRSAIHRLEDIGFLTTRTTNRFTIAYIINYDTYQDVKLRNNQQNNQKITIKQPTDNQQITTPKEYNTLKELKEEEISTQDTPDIIKQTVEYLNDQTQSNFNPQTYTTQTLIIDRIHEGATLNDFKAVIKKKASQWIVDEKMVGNLRPTTLFAADKFEGYLQEAKRNGKGKSKTKKKLSAVQLSDLGLNILSNFGKDKFDEFCKQNSLTIGDADAIREKWQRENKQSSN